MSEQHIDQLYPWLLPTLTIHRDGDQLLLRDFEREAVYTRHAGELVAALELIDGSHSLGELLRSSPTVAGLLADLADNDWLVQLSRPLDVITADDDARSRQLSYFAHLQRFLPDRAFEELALRRVLIVGTGGIGSHLAMNLAGSGVKRITLNDPDIVSQSNLNRQLYFTRRDVGVLKVRALERALHERFDDLELETSTVDHDLAPEAPLPSCDAIVVCGELESIWSRPDHVRGVPLLMAGYFGSTAVVGPCIVPGVAPTWSELMTGRERARGARVRANQITRPHTWNSSGAAVNCAAGGLLVEATVRLLAPSLGGPILVHERLELDMRTLSSTRFDVAAAASTAARAPSPAPGAQ